MIANSINEDKTIYKDINYSKNDLKEIELAAKLHDVGKISIPEWVIDKSTKLQKLIDNGTKIEVFLGGVDKIIDAQKAKEFFKDFATVYYIKEKGHLL